MKVFLGGTTHKTIWRLDFMKFLIGEGIDYFNPVVAKWTAEDALEEERQKKLCDVVLFVITPNMKGFYSIWEMAALAHTCPEKLVVCVTRSDRELMEVDDWDVWHENKWNEEQGRSIAEIERRCKELGVPFYTDIISLHQHFRLLKEGKSPLQLNYGDRNT